MIVLDVCAAIPFAVKHDWRMAIYWLAAATLTTCVTFKGDNNEQKKDKYHEIKIIQTESKR
jgi:hypothetical protein